jgi:hypothetical protein
LIFGNRVQLAEIKILSLIEDLKYNEDFFQACEDCQDKFSITELQKVDNCLYCENCISENFYSCAGCGELIYNDDIHSFEDSGYCKDCYFEVKQQAYKSHEIVSPILQKLARSISRFNLKEIEFKIDGHFWSIENYSQENFRLGSWGANSWVDIGNCEADLLRAIDFNLGSTWEKLTNIYENDIEVNL